jgi:putative spermidine/putrescine transport system permease protein
MKWSRGQLGLLLLPGLMVSGLLLVVPLGYLLRFSLVGGPDAPPDSAPLAAFAHLAGDTYALAIIARTFLISLAVTLLCLLLGLPLAQFIWRSAPSWRPWLTLLALSPLLVSVVVSAYGWLVLLGSKGLVNQALIGLGVIAVPLTLLYTDLSMVLGLVHVLLPFMVLSLLAALDRIDPLLLDAGHTLGGSRALVWRSVILPLTLPGIGAGTTVVFSLAVSSYVTPAVLGPSGPNFITTLIYEDFISLYDWGVGAALAVVLLAATGLAVLGWTAWLSRRLARTGMAG